MSFEEAYAKPLIVNTTNSRIIRDQTGVIDAYKWIGFSVEFHFDNTVRMKISSTETRKGGIRIKSVNTNGLVAPLEDLSARIKQCTNRAEVTALWSSMNESEQAEYKDAVTNKFKTL